jgi:predicted small metal-binding protein
LATRRAAPSTIQSPVSDQEDDMRAIECPCGHHLEGADDDELFRLAREHVDRDHPEMQRSDDDIRARVAVDAYDVAPVA